MLPSIKCLLVDDLEENLLALSALLQEGDDVEILTAGLPPSGGKARCVRASRSPRGSDGGRAVKPGQTRSIRVRSMSIGNGAVNSSRF